ncbi:MAG: alpha/beta hydrolase, partial [Lachnospiraceae bacterium]|nr:alpha/beta hydrolase [Lachnospiraceae bacterium]
YHYSFGKMRPIDALSENTVPMLFIHGDADQLIPYQNSERMAAKTAGYSEVRLIPGATHAESVLKDPAAYREYVGAFLKKIEVL